MTVSGRGVLYSSIYYIGINGLSVAARCGPIELDDDTGDIHDTRSLGPVTNENRVL